jgi:hypothetical protein
MVNYLLQGLIRAAPSFRLSCLPEGLTQDREERSVLFHGARAPTCVASVCFHPRLILGTALAEIDAHLYARFDRPPRAD